MLKSAVQSILNSREHLKPFGDGSTERLWAMARGQEAEGGCGVIGMACNEQIAGRHLLQALDQMRNRGNNKGGGIAAVGLVPEEFGVTQEILENDYLLSIAYLDPGCREEVEGQYILPQFEIDHMREQPQLDDFRELELLEVRPPEVVQYFVRVKEAVFQTFRKAHQLGDLDRRRIEDEIVYQNSFQLNRAFYASMGETRAFVLSHGKNLLVLKMVGYGDDVVRYYRLEDMRAHVWIGHHRYPTKGRVWHPGGAHPFVGLNEALVHNGDFANYASISEYLAQRNVYPLFLTDTEVSVQVFDLLRRTYGYPLEYVIESLAPTTERDFALLEPEKQRIYRMLQTTHMHCSPDGPWFFLIAQSEEEERDGFEDGRIPVYRLTCITDTSMLRPQVFAWQQGGKGQPAIGFAASEKQAIDAALWSLSKEDPRFWARADRYWNARGGSHTDGGAFIFSVLPNEGTGGGTSEATAKLVCMDKFGRLVMGGRDRKPYYPNGNWTEEENDRLLRKSMVEVIADKDGQHLFLWVRDQLPFWSYERLKDFLTALEATAVGDEGRERALETLSLLMDRRYPTGKLRRSSLLSIYDQSFAQLMACIREVPTRGYKFVSAHQPYPYPPEECQTVVIDARGFDPEGPNSMALEMVRLFERGFRKFIVAHTRGHRFIGNGLGPEARGVRIDIYGSPGDYLASGIDGVEIYVHGNAQDQLAQIMKSGKLVVHGDVGQTFGYAAKGGEVYILGNAAGRPMINAVGSPRVVINGTCLDYLAESFMAGDPLNGGGFVILNGVQFNDEGVLEDLASPYPGGNLFSLASGGAIYVRDPHHKLTRDQLNGGEFTSFSQADWAQISPYLVENARLFDIPVKMLLEVKGKERRPEEVYRKISPVKVRALQAEEAWVQKH